MNADEIEKAKELARALRDYASDCDDDDCFQCNFACVCGKYRYNAPKIIADLIENLTAQLTESQRRAQDARNELCQKCGRYRDAHKGACDGCRWMA